MSWTRAAARVVGGLTLVAAMSLTDAAHAPAASPDIVGWWHKAHVSSAQDPVILPALPVQVMPTTGMLVANDPSGPFAVGAVRYRAAAPAVLKLRIDANNENLGTPVVRACPTTTSWDAASGGVWDRRPAYDCAKGSDGQLSADGESVSFLLGSDAGVTGADLPTISVALVPADGSTPFTVAFEHPDEDSLVGSAVTTPTPSPGTAGEPTSAPPVEYVDPQTGETITFPSVEVDRSIADPEPAPQASAPAASEVAAPQSSAPVDDQRGQRIMAVALLGALVGGLWWFGARPTRPPRLLLRRANDAPTYKV